MIELFLRDIDASDLTQDDVEEIAIYTEGYSGGDILSICQGAMAIAREESTPETNKHDTILGSFPPEKQKSQDIFSGELSITIYHLRQALQDVSGSVTQNQLAGYQYFMDNFGARGLIVVKETSEKQEVSLKWKCRECILQNLKRERLTAVSALPLPRKLKLFLLRRDRVEIEIHN